MIKNFDYYQIQNANFNFTPTKLIRHENGTYTFQNLVADQTIVVHKNVFREIEIEQIHLNRLGFKNEQLNEIIATPLYATLKNTPEEFVSRFFGYLVFEKKRGVRNSKKEI